MIKPAGYDDNREQNIKIARERCDKDVCYYPRCSCGPEPRSEMILPGASEHEARAK